MRVVRGALPDVEADRRVTQRLLDGTERTDEPSLRVWMPPRQLAFGRRDSALDGYERAREIAADRGYAPIDRSAGGSAVAYTGTTVAFAIAVPVEGGRGWGDIESRYRETISDLVRALETVGATVTRGEPDGSFCPGEHSLQGTGKIAGIAQRVRRESALVGGCVLASEADERAVSRVLDPVYATLGIPFDPSAVGSVEGAGGNPDSGRLVEAIEAAFVGDRETTPVSAGETLSDGGP
jgi:lipoate-protein ligase A